MRSDPRALVLDARKGHPVARNEMRWVGQPRIERLVGPGDVGAFERRRTSGEARQAPGLTAPETCQAWAGHVPVRRQGVTRGAGAKHLAPPSWIARLCCRGGEHERTDSDPS